MLTLDLLVVLSNSTKSYAALIGETTIYIHANRAS